MHDDEWDDDGDLPPPPERAPAARHRTPDARPAPNVDTVGIAGHPSPARAAGAAPLAARLRPFGQPPGPAARPERTRPERTRPEASNVDIVGTGAPGRPRHADGGPDDIGAALRELDRLDALGALAAAAPTPTRLVEPPSGAPSAAHAGSGRSGPGRPALEATRRAAKQRLARRASALGAVPGADARPSRASASDRARPGTTVSQATLDQYLRRGQLLFARYRREAGLPPSAEEISPVEWVNWLLSLKPRLRSTSWRHYRQAASHFLEGFPGHETEEALAMLDADVIDRSRPPAPPRDELQRRTSALKEKRFPLEDFERAAEFLRRGSRSKLAPVLLDWLRAGILTGLRPIEWRACDLEIREDPTAARGRRAWLYVLNAKATNGRGTGVARTLDLSAFPDSDLACVRRMVERGRDWLETGRFAEMQNDCSALLYRVTARLWPARRYAYALYSARHQAIANWKAILRPEEIAAIVGHGITATAAEHYGKRRSSWPPERIPAPPRPVPEELGQVRERMRLYEDRISFERRMGLRREGEDPAYPLG